VVNVDWFFVSHRLPIALAAKEAGHEVHLAATITLPRSVLEGYGFVIHDIGVNRSGTGFFDNVKLLLSLMSIFWKVKPHVAHMVTIKPVLIGGIAARLSPVKGVVFAISGLGHTFVDNSFPGVVRRKIVSFLYRLALGKLNKRVVFQNPHDCGLIKKTTNLSEESIIMIPGSGVDLSGYNFKCKPGDGIRLFMAARLLTTKGVVEYVEAARIVKGLYPNVEFLLAGDPDPDNPASISAQLLESWKSEGVVTVLGFRSDITSLMAGSNVVVLPSYYGEGLPKVLIEAAATGCAVITTDMPGCRDAIEPNVTGLLVPPKDIRALSSAMLQLVSNPEVLSGMGLAGRRRAEQIFDIKTVVNTHMNAYRDLVS
jgi:glycosyltransferase involved in cell wall biosynthesis